MSHTKRNLRIVIIDDDIEDLTDWEAVATERPEVTFLIYQTASAALLRLGQQPFNYNVDAIILDLELTDLDGLTLTKQLRRNEHIRRRATPIKIWWATDWPFDPHDEHDPVARVMREQRVCNLIPKAASLRDILAKVEASLSGAPDSPCIEYA